MGAIVSLDHNRIFRPCYVPLCVPYVGSVVFLVNKPYRWAPSSSVSSVRGCRTSPPDYSALA